MKTNHLPTNSVYWQPFNGAIPKAICYILYAMFDKVENLAPTLLVNDWAVLYPIMIVLPVAINLYLRICICIHVFSITITPRQRVSDVKGNHLSDQTKGYQASLQVYTQSFSFSRLISTHNICWGCHWGLHISLFFPSILTQAGFQAFLPFLTVSISLTLVNLPQATAANSEEAGLYVDPPLHVEADACMNTEHVCLLGVGDSLLWSYSRVCRG